MQEHHEECGKLHLLCMHALAQRFAAPLLCSEILCMRALTQRFAAPLLCSEILHFTSASATTMAPNDGHANGAL